MLKNIIIHTVVAPATAMMYCKNLAKVSQYKIFDFLDFIIDIFLY